MVYRRFGVKLQNTYEMCKVLVGTPISLDVGALAAIIPPDHTPGGNCVVKLLATAAPVPSPESLGSDVNFARWPRLAAGTCRADLAALSSQRGGAWRVLDWCNNFKSAKHFLFVKCT